MGLPDDRWPNTVDVPAITRVAARMVVGLTRHRSPEPQRVLAPAHGEQPLRRQRPGRAQEAGGAHILQPEAER